MILIIFSVIYLGGIVIFCVGMKKMEHEIRRTVYLEEEEEEEDRLFQYNIQGIFCCILFSLFFVFGRS